MPHFYRIQTLNPGVLFLFTSDAYFWVLANHNCVAVQTLQPFNPALLLPGLLSVGLYFCIPSCILNFTWGVAMEWALFKKCAWQWSVFFWAEAFHLLAHSSPLLISSCHVYCEHRWWHADARLGIWRTCVLEGGLSPQHTLTLLVINNHCFKV